jgi:hypothetical protein
MVAEMDFLKQVCRMFLDDLPTLNRTLVRHLDRTLRIERGQAGCTAVVECFVIFLIERAKRLA